MSGSVTVVTDDNFETLIKGGKPVMVDFWAVWCGPCKMVAPHVEALAQEYGDRAVIGKVDVDKNKKHAMQFGIQSIPTLLFFKDGKVVDRVVGAVDRKLLQQKLDALL